MDHWDAMCHIKLSHLFQVVPLMHLEQQQVSDKQSSQVFLLFVLLLVLDLLPWYKHHDPHNAKFFHIHYGSNYRLQMINHDFLNVSYTTDDSFATDDDSSVSAALFYGDHVLRHVAQRSYTKIKALRHDVRPTVANQNLHVNFGELRQK